MNNKTRFRFFAAALALLLAAALPTLALAEEAGEASVGSSAQVASGGAPAPGSGAAPQGPVLLAAFAPLADEVAFQGYNAGSIEGTAALALPPTLSATTAAGDTVDVPVSWACTAAETTLGEAFETTAFAPGQEGRYTFAPTPGEGYALAENAAPPQISVFIRPAGGIGIAPMMINDRYTVDGLVYKETGPTSVQLTGFADPNDTRPTLDVPQTIQGNGKPFTVTTVGAGAFFLSAGNPTLTAINLPASVTGIGDEAFRGCGALAAITLPDGVTSIGDRAFRDCGALAAITLPNSLTSIGNSAFYACGALAAVTLPGSVTTIGASAFFWLLQPAKHRHPQWRHHHRGFIVFRLYQPGTRHHPKQRHQHWQRGVFRMHQAGTDRHPVQRYQHWQRGVS